MGTLLAKLPQQRIRAPENHPTIDKLEKLFDYMDDLGIDIRVDFDRIYVKDNDRPKDGEWVIRDVINSDYLSELPCHVDQYKITQDVDIAPREAQVAPANPVVPVKASGLNHFKIPKQGKKPKAAKSKTAYGPPPTAVDPRVKMVPKKHGFPNALNLRQAAEHLAQNGIRGKK